MVQRALSTLKLPCLLLAVVGVGSTLGCLERDPAFIDAGDTDGPTSQTNGDGDGDGDNCGNGVIDDGEDCDGNNVNGASCQSLGFVTGELACTSCAFDTASCSNCGNDTIDPGEQCDGSEVGTQSCGDLGFGGGSLACTADCTTLDFSQCTDPVCTQGPVPPADQACPDECTGGCTADTCTINCDGNNNCQNANIACPPGWQCEVSCDGNNACGGATVACPADYACTVDCDAKSACTGAVVNCGDGLCDVDCDGNGTCNDLTLNCGARDGNLDCSGVTVGSGMTANASGGSACGCAVTGC